MNNRTKSLASLFLVLLLGVVLGLGIAKFSGYCRDGNLGKSSIAQRADFMAKKLDLDQEQRVRVLNILQSHKDEFSIIRQEFRPKVEALREKVSAEIEGVLRSEQKPKFEKLRQRMQNRWDSKNSEAK